MTRSFQAAQAAQAALLAEAEAAAAGGDYRRAIDCHLAVMEQLSRHALDQVDSFSEGPYAQLLMAAAEHVLELAGRHHFLEALALIEGIRVYFANSESMTQALDGIERRCIDRCLYARQSPQPTDVLLCCAQADVDALAAPLAEALRELGVLVAAEPVVVSRRPCGAALSECAAESDAVVPILSPDFFAAEWPQEALHGLLREAGAGRGMLIPIWHHISRPEVLAASVLLEKTLAFDTARSGIESLAQGIADIVRPDLASGALHKLFWAALLNQRTLDEALSAAEFELAVRHDTLDEELMGRIRLIRAAFLDGLRAPLSGWVDAFRRELEPHAAVAEWERIARAFQDARALQRHVAAGPEAALDQLLPDDVDPADRRRLAEGYLAFVGYPATRLSLLIWLVTQPIAGHVDLGFPGPAIALARYIVEEGLTVGVEEGDFATQFARHGDGYVAKWEGEGPDFGPGILHTEEERPWTKAWDVFISHASEDKAQFVRPLADALQDYGVKVWYDTFNLRPGLSLGESIDAGIAEAEFGIVMLSPHFVAKEWPRYEFEALSRRRTAQGERLITLWHALPVPDRPAWTQALDPGRCLDTAEQPLTALTMQIVEWVRPDVAQFTRRRLAYAEMQERQAGGGSKIVRVEAGEIQAAPRRYERLPPDLQRRVELLRAVLLEVDPHTLDYWLDGFLRDLYPEQQIAFMERTAAMVQEAILVVDWLQARAPEDPSARAVRRHAAATHRDVYAMVRTLQDDPAADDRLADLRARFGEEVANSVGVIVQSPEVIEVLGP